MAENTYKIGEVAEILNLKSYVLRFWETEFPQVAPLRTEKGQRFYTENDVAVLKRIKNLLHEQGMTIDGARRILVADARRSADLLHFNHSPQQIPLPGAPVPSSAPRSAAPQAAAPAGQQISAKFIREELLALRKILLARHSN